MPVWAVTGQPVSEELVRLLCDGDLPTRVLLSGQVVVL